jgi:hypothetical protein
MTLAIILGVTIVLYISMRLYRDNFQDTPPQPFASIPVLKDSDIQNTINVGRQFIEQRPDAIESMRKVCTDPIINKTIKRILRI